MRIHYQQELKSIYMCQDVRIAKKNTTMLNVKYIIVMTYNKCLQTHFHKCVKSSAFLSRYFTLLEKRRSFEWHRLVLVHRRITLDLLRSSGRFSSCATFATDHSGKHSVLIYTR